MPGDFRSKELTLKQDNQQKEDKLAIEELVRPQHRKNMKPSQNLNGKELNRI